MRAKLSEKDKMLLIDLYKLQVLAAKQIKSLYYENSNYGYFKMRKLQEKGYLSSKPLIKGRKKITQYYYLTEEGIRAVSEIQELSKTRTAYRNKPENMYNTERMLMINDIYISLKLLEKEGGNIGTWKWLDSRELKAKYQMNRNDLIAGMIENTVTGETYGIYVPFNLTKVESIKSVVRMISNEINNHLPIKNNIVLCTDDITLNIFREEVSPVRNKLLVMSFEEGIYIIYNMLSRLLESKLEELYSKTLKIPVNQIKEEAKIFATHTTSEYYLTEYLSHDIIKLYFINRYKDDNKETKKMIVYCWEKDLEDLQEKLITHERYKEKIKLYPIKWASDYFDSFIEYNSIVNNFIVTTKSKLPDNLKSKPMAFSFSNSIYKFLESQFPSGTRSDYIENMISNSEEYQNYIKSGKATIPTT